MLKHKFQNFINTKYHTFFLFTKVLLYNFRSSLLIASFNQFMKYRFLHILLKDFFASGYYAQSIQKSILPVRE